jgi:hypothetical protein
MTSKKYYRYYFHYSWSNCYVSLALYWMFKIALVTSQLKFNQEAVMYAKCRLLGCGVV